MTWFAQSHLSGLQSQLVAPQPQDILPTETGRLEPIRWRLFLDGKPIGWAVHHIRRRPDGYGEIASTVRIERLSIEHIAQQGLGGLGAFVMHGLSQGADAVPGFVSMTVENSFRFDEFAQLQGFSCQVVEDGWGECIHIQGAVEGDSLRMKAYLMLGDDGETRQRKPVYQTRLPLPADRTVVDALSPRPALSRLRVGQKWTSETYRPFFPSSPMQTVEAEVTGREILDLHGQNVRAYHVVYRRGADEALSVDRHLGDAWALDDGTVVRQTLTWGQFVLTFEREATTRFDQEAP